MGNITSGHHMLVRTVIPSFAHCQTKILSEFRFHSYNLYNADTVANVRREIIYGDLNEAVVDLRLCHQVVYSIHNNEFPFVVVDKYKLNINLIN